MKYLGTKFYENKSIDRDELIKQATDFYENLILEIIDERSDASIGVISWLKMSDFYTAPASTQYHDNEPGGLLLHTLRVYNEMLDLIKLPKFENINMSSAALVCLVHDWVKIGAYEGYKRNVKNQETGKWEQVDAYKYAEIKPVPMGHGATSAYTAGKFFDLSLDEYLAIRWHMGAWQVCTQEMTDLRQANERFPIVHLLQFADQMAIVNY